MLFGDVRSQLLDYYLRRTAHSPHWKFLHPLLGKLVLNASPERQWLRIAMNEDIERTVLGLEPASRSVLEISGDRWATKPWFKSYRGVDYPEFDICADVLDGRFDLIFAEQVFEHVLWPYRAGRNVFAMLSDGGVFVVGTPFLVKLHQHPYDCSRWSEMGLRCLLVECGFEESKITTRSWGNRSCVRANFSRWQTFRPGWHSLENEPDFPVMVWAFAVK